jgi:hypothetical protein
MFAKKKPLVFTKVKPDVENAADAKKPGDAKEDAPKKTKGNTAALAQKAATVLASKGGDVGKHNNGKTTGFSAVEKSATKEGYSPAVAEKIAGAQYQKMKRKGQL